MEKLPVKDLADVPPYQLVHSFGMHKHTGDGLWYAADQIRPWCVYYAFAGHYFPTVDQALRYAADRGFIRSDALEKIKNYLNERGFLS